MNPESGVFMKTSEGEYVLSPREALRVIRRRWLVIALVVVTLVGAATVLSFLQTPMYEGSIKLLIGQEQNTNAPTNLGNDVQGLQQLTQTLVQVVGTRSVAEGVIQELNLSTRPEDFLNGLAAEQISDTQIIQVNYDDTDPQRAKQIADTIGEVFSRHVSEVSPSANAITATPWEPAVVSEDPVSPNPVRNGLLALVVGAILGMGLALLMDYFDDRSPSEEV
jgi:capsular polysaccharide biosynthesis protein